MARSSASIKPSKACSLAKANSQEDMQIKNSIEKNPSLMVRSLAKDMGLSELAVTNALPESMICQVPAENFVEIWEEVCTWEKVCLLIESSGAVLEFSGPLPKGKMGHGMYNLVDKKFPLGGHLLVGQIEAIFLVSKPNFGKESHALHFFGKDGSTAFAIYLGRDEKREIIPEIKTSYLNLWEKYKAV